MKILKWTTTSEYVDIATGEIITKRNATKNYIIIKKEKHGKNNQDGTGTITITNICTKTGKQLKCF